MTHNSYQPDCASEDILVILRNYIPGENDDYVPLRIKQAADEIERLRNPSQNAVTGSSGTHPVTEGAADNAPPAILKARGDLAVENRNYWQAEAERWAARIIELEAELQRRSGVQTVDERAQASINHHAAVAIVKQASKLYEDHLSDEAAWEAMQLEYIRLITAALSSSLSSADRGRE